MRKDKPKREYRLSPQGLAALREANRRVQPWTRTTGPKTVEGKARAKVNSLRHGERSIVRMRERHEMAELLRMLKSTMPSSMPV